MDYNLFSRYGWNVMRFYMNSKVDRRSDGMRYYNPMCAAFPTEVGRRLSILEQLSNSKVSCLVPNIGAGGGPQHHSGLCILTQVLLATLSFYLLLQNIINEKIYLVLWFWYAFLVPVSFIFGFYRLFTILCYRIRFNLLYKTVQNWKFKHM